MRFRHHLFFQTLVFIILPAFLSSSIISPAQARQLFSAPTSTQPGTGRSMLLQGLTIDPQEPLRFDFLISLDEAQTPTDAITAEAERMIKDFLAAMTVPEESKWVNLSPTEPDRIIPEGLKQTQMGQDMLAQDYVLKQLTASLMNPDGETGKKFWERIYSKIYEERNSPQPPLYTKRGRVVRDSTIPPLRNHSFIPSPLRGGLGRGNQEPGDPHPTSPVKGEGIKNIFHEIILPLIEEEINTGEAFARLRQIYQAMILAVWYKRKLADSLLAQAYADRNKTAGISVDDPQAHQDIYNRYLDAFRQGTVNLIREEYDPKHQTIQTRRYFTGGADLNLNKAMTAKPVEDLAQLQTVIGTSTMARIRGDFAPERISTKTPSDQAMVVSIWSILIFIGIFALLHWAFSHFNESKVEREIRHSQEKMSHIDTTDHVHHPEAQKNHAMLAAPFLGDPAMLDFQLMMTNLLWVAGSEVDVTLTYDPKGIVAGVLIVLFLGAIYAVGLSFKGKKDKAMMGQTPGGIDFGDRLMNVKAARQDNAMIVPVDAALTGKVKRFVSGFRPVITSVKILPSGLAGYLSGH